MSYLSQIIETESRMVVPSYWRQRIVIVLWVWSFSFAIYRDFGMDGSNKNKNKKQHGCA